MDELTREQKWLRRLVGEWEYETQMQGAPDASCEAGSMTGTEKVRAIGEHWILGELHSSYKGQPMVAITSLGYDAAQKKVAGTWFCSMMAHMWLYTGTLDASGHTMTLDTTGPDMKDPSRMRQYQDIVTIDENGKRSMSSQILGDDGQWQPFIKMTFRRKAT